MHFTFLSSSSVDSFRRQMTGHYGDALCVCSIEGKTQSMRTVCVVQVSTSIWSHLLVSSCTENYDVRTFIHSEARAQPRMKILPVARKRRHENRHARLSVESF